MATGLVTSTMSPNHVDFGIVSPHFNAECFVWIGFCLIQSPSKIVPIIRHRNDLTVGDTDEFACVGRGRIVLCFVEQFLGKLAIQHGDVL